jgi:hypothetical protein
LLPQYRLWFISILILSRIWEWELWAHPFVDWFLRSVIAEEIISGGQCIHDAELLTKQVIECGIDVNTLSSYIDSSGETTFLWHLFDKRVGLKLYEIFAVACKIINLRRGS